MAEISKRFTTEFYEAIYQVDEDQDGMRLDQYCSHFLVSFSRQQIKKKIAAGEVKIRNRPFPHKASVKVYYREVVEFITYRGDMEDEYWRGEKLELEFTPKVIFEDEDIIAISKPPYMTTHPTGRHLFNCATVFFETKYGHTIHSIHRLDRETSGVLLLGKSPKAAQLCTDFFEKDQVKKCYFFIAHAGHPPKFPFVAKERLGSEDDFIPRLYVHCYPENSMKGKHAKTTFQKLYEEGGYILGLAYPKTGRQHQIRSHAAHHGFSLLGDKLYNGDPLMFGRFKDGIATQEDHDQMQLSRHALHATALHLPYPIGSSSLLRAPIPNDFKEWIEKSLPKCDIKLIEEKIDQLVSESFKGE
jgi:23S rRNA pseudouridine1911/1915/1917 synthase